MQADKWLSVEGIADYMGVSKETIYRWLERRTIPAYRIGKLWKFKSSEIDAWVISGRAASFKTTNEELNGQVIEESN